jgi:hypothetical protein
MKVKTAELSGAALDWAVAKAEGRNLRLDPMGFRKDAPRAKQAGWWIWEDSSRDTSESNPRQAVQLVVGTDYAPSKTWAQGGSIIEREGINLMSEARDGSLWKAQFNFTREVLFLRPMRLVHSYCISRGPTALTAAMRCYAQSKLGDEVDVPEELLPPRAIVDSLTPVASNATN